MNSKKSLKDATLDKWFSESSKGEKEDFEKYHKSIETNLYKLINDWEKKVKLPEIKDKNIYIDLEKDIIDKYKPKKILIVTEKPKVAERLAFAISKETKPKKVVKNYAKTKVVKWLTVFKGIRISIVPLRGHIIEFTTIDKFSGDWAKSDPIGIILDNNALKEIVVDKGIENELIKEARDSDILFIATDADEEGANIGLEAYKIIKKNVKEIPTYQLWFLSLDKKELWKAFLKPIKPKWTWAYSVEGRRIIDAIVGFSSTRELTLFLRNNLIKLGSKVASIGRVQTPTLYLIYLREKEIEEFKPKPYWIILANTLINGNIYNFTHKDSPIYSKEKALDLFNKLKDSKDGIIDKIETKTIKNLPPTPLNTTKALYEINRLFGISSSKALKILEELYLNGLITYPRTDTDKYPDDYNHRENLLRFLNSKKFGEIVSIIINRGIKLTRNGKNLVGDHLPITPIDLAEKNDPRLPTQDHEKIYNFIVERYLALFLDPAVIQKRKIYLRVKDEIFYITDTKIIDLGYFRVYPYDMPKENQIPVHGGEKIRLKSIELREDYTKPPKPLAEYELIKIMERLGLGTKSTRQNHIETLIKRGYIERRGKTLKITPVGKSLMEYLEKIWPDFVKPFFSAYVQKLMRKVMVGEITKDDMVNESKKIFLELFENMRSTLPEMGQEIMNAINLLAKDKRIFRCPNCGGDVIKVSKRTSKYILKCIKCGKTFYFPTFKKAFELNNIKCLRCGANPIGLHRKRIIYICPTCYYEIGPCFKCPQVGTCDVKKLLEKEEERFIVGQCMSDGLALFVPEKRLIICKKGKKIIFSKKLPQKGTIKLLKSKICKECGWKIFRISSGKYSYYYCANCGKVINF